MTYQRRNELVMQIAHHSFSTQRRGRAPQRLVPWPDTTAMPFVKKSAIPESNRIRPTHRLRKSCASITTHFDL